jgi:3-deoxy-D-manno-octulosonate 8-phosphate phosphatase (KDO 8-P phosphatase)
MQPFKRFEDKLSAIKMLALDVDGVLTKGDLIYTASGEFIKVFNVKDGLGLKLLQEKGIIVAIITARKSDVVTTRMKELGIRFLYQGVDDKLQLIEDLTGQFMLYWNNIAYMGDDLNDLPVIQKAGFAACPSDAIDEVISACHYTSRKEGGKGAVREVADMILKCQQNK